MGNTKRTTPKTKKATNFRVTKIEKVRALQKAVEKKRSRHFFMGQEQSGLVIRWLEDPQRPPNDEVEQLIALEARFKAGDVLAGREVVEYANSVANRWELGYAPRLGFGGASGRDRVIVTEPTMDTRVVKPKQSLAFMKAMELVEQNLLTRVRRCRLPGCGKWFHAVLDKAIYHTEQCRLQAIAATPEYRERKKKYMRARRLAQAKGGK